MGRDGLIREEAVFNGALWRSLGERNAYLYG